MKKTFWGKLASLSAVQSREIVWVGDFPAVRTISIWCQAHEEVGMVFSRSAANLKYHLVLPKHNICSF